MFRLTTLTVLFFAWGRSAAAVADPPLEHGAGVELLAKFRHWVQEHGREYASEAEELMRLKVWAANHGAFPFCEKSGHLSCAARRNSGCPLFVPQLSTRRRKPWGVVTSGFLSQITYPVSHISTIPHRTHPSPQRSGRCDLYFGTQ